MDQTAFLTYNSLKMNLTHKSPPCLFEKGLSFRHACRPTPTSKTLIINLPSNRHSFGHRRANSIDMIHEFEVPAYISDTLPQLKREFSTGCHVYDSIQVLTDYTKRMALQHDFKEVKTCMSLIEKIYGKGDALVKNAVENIFIFSFSSMRLLCNIVEWRMVQSIMPSSLYMLYMHQVLRSA